MDGETWLGTYAPTLQTPESVPPLLTAMMTYSNAVHRAFHTLDGSDVEPEDEMVLLLDDLLGRCYALGFQGESVTQATNEAVDLGWLVINRGAGHFRLWERETV